MQLTLPFIWFAYVYLFVPSICLSSLLCVPHKPSLVFNPNSLGRQQPSGAWLSPRICLTVKFFQPLYVACSGGQIGVGGGGVVLFFMYVCINDTHTHTGLLQSTASVSLSQSTRPVCQFIKINCKRRFFYFKGVTAAASLLMS